MTLNEMEHPVSNIELPISSTQSPAITVERAAYVAVGLLAAGLRFFQLGLRPLSEAEAGQALAAYGFVHTSGQAVPAGTVPALFSGNLLSFTLLGANDFTARLMPALAGLVLVLLPYLLRRRLGRGGALAASLLLAISPSAVFFSRDVDGAVLVAACGLAIAVGLIDYVDTHSPAYLYMAAVGLGLGLCAGPGIWTLVFILGVFGLLLFGAEQLLHQELGWSSLLDAWRAARGEAGLLARAGAVLVATFALVAMAFVLNPAGLGNAADLFAAWGSGFLPETGGNPVIYPGLLLLVYEPLVVFLGLLEVGVSVWKWRSRQQGGEVTSLGFPHTAFLGFWAIGAFAIVTIAGHRPAGGMLLVVVPLALLAGQAIERGWHWLAERSSGHEVATVTAVALALLVFLYLQVAAYGLTDNRSTVSLGSITLYNSTAYLLLASVALLLLAGLGAAAWAWRGPSLLAAGGGLALVVSLGLFGFRSTWALNMSDAADPRQLMIGQTTAPDVREVATQLEELSLDKAGDRYTLPVTVDSATGPAMAWYLRDFQEVTMVDGLSTPPDTVAALTLVMQDPPIGETFRGRGFPLETRWAPWGLGGQGVVRWLLFTEGPLPVVDKEVVLWVEGES
jgi:uncharacterized protein (TIGR03663 family)